MNDDQSGGYSGGLGRIYLWPLGGACRFEHLQNLLRQGNTETLQDLGHGGGHLGTLDNGLPLQPVAHRPETADHTKRMGTQRAVSHSAAKRTAKEPPIQTRLCASGSLFISIA